MQWLNVGWELQKGLGNGDIPDPSSWVQLTEAMSSLSLGSGSIYTTIKHLSCVKNTARPSFLTSAPDWKKSAFFNNL